MKKGKCLICSIVRKVSAEGLSKKWKPSAMRVDLRQEEKDFRKRNHLARAIILIFAVGETVRKVTILRIPTLIEHCVRTVSLVKIDFSDSLGRGSETIAGGKNKS